MRARGLPLVSLLWGSLAFAAPYDLNNRKWDGLSTFSSMVASVGCQAKVVAELDWNALELDDAVLILYPKQEVSVDSALDFLRSGGRLVYADDHGRGTMLLGALGIERHTAQPDKDTELYNDNPAFPVAKMITATALGQSAPALVTNHPSVFDTPLPATFGLSASQAVVVEGHLGLGRFVALSDPSLFINNMLEITENKAFITALVDDICRRDHAIILATGQFSEVGVSSEKRSFNRWPHGFNEMLKRLNDGLANLEPVGLSTLGLTLALAILTLFFWFFPPSPPIDGHWTRLRRSEQLVDEVSVLAQLRGEILARLNPLVGNAWERPVNDVVWELEKSHDAATASLARELLTALRQVRWRPQNPQGGEEQLLPDGRISERRLSELVTLAAQFFSHLGQASGHTEGRNV